MAGPPLRSGGGGLRLGAGLLLAVFGTGVLVTEYAHALVSVLPPPDHILEFFARYQRGEMPLLLIVVLVAPVVEAVIFRGLLLRGLLALGRPVFAVPISAATFAAAHVNIWQLVPAFCMGLLLGWVYARTRSLIPCILGHMAWNAQWWIAVGVLDEPVPGYTLEATPGGFPQQPVWWLALGLAALVSGIHLLRARLRSSVCRYRNQ